MDQESNQMEQHPVQCRNGCGFYSNAGTEGLCSVCYKDMIKKKQQPPANMPASLSSMPSSMANMASSLTPAPGAMASLSIDESSNSNSITSPIKHVNALDTASPTVIFPPSDKKDDPHSGASAVATSSELGSSDITNSTSPSQEDENGPKEGKKKKNRCLMCKKKVGLTGFTCRCGGLFCSIHRYSDKHGCDFDYKELGQEEIRKSNPVIVAKKVQQI